MAFNLQPQDYAKNRNVGFFECVAVRGVEGSHHFIGSIQVMSGAVIREALKAEGWPDEVSDHAFTADAGEPSRVKYGQEDIAHCVHCGQAEDRPVHRSRLYPFDQNVETGEVVR